MNFVKTQNSFILKKKIERHRLEINEEIIESRRNEINK